MIRALLRIAACAASLAACGCGGPSPFVMNPKYTDAKFAGRTLHVFPLQDVEIENSDDFRDDLVPKEATGSLDKKSVLGRIFFRKLDGLADHAKLIHDSSVNLDDKRFIDTVLNLPGEHGSIEAEFRFPAAITLADSALEPDLGLQIQRIRFARTRTQGSGMMWVPSAAPGAAGGGMMVGGGGSYQVLELDGSYILWDYKAREPVAYGRFQASSPFQFFMDASDWEKTAESAAKFIVVHSPLKGAKVKRSEASAKRPNNL